MDVVSTPIAGCLVLKPRTTRDARGLFAKTFVPDVFRAHGLPERFAEEYHSMSGANVIRGMHFQLPPFDHAKIVCCVWGRALDVVVDLRRGSPSFLRHFSLELKGDDPACLYIPPGLAHGFCVPDETSVMTYKTTSGYSPSHDAGIRWDSFGFDWPISDPVVSERDKSFAVLSSFESPFEFDAGSPAL